MLTKDIPFGHEHPDPGRPADDGVGLTLRKGVLAARAAAGYREGRGNLGSAERSKQASIAMNGSREDRGSRRLNRHRTYEYDAASSCVGRSSRP
jgi:hypothetical protein